MVVNNLFAVVALVFGNHAHGARRPDLPAVGVPTQDQVSARRGCIFKVPRLMVKPDGVAVVRATGQQLRSRKTAAVRVQVVLEKGSAVFINDNYSFNFLNALSKKPDMYDRDKAFCLSLPADGFLKGVTHNGHDIAIYCGSPEEFATKEIPSTFCIHTNSCA